MGIAYCIIAIVFFVASCIITGTGLGAFSLLADEFVGSMNGFSFAIDFYSNSSLAVFILYVTMIQSTYISKMVGKAVSEDDVVNKGAIFIGNIVLGCFLGLMYQSLPYDLLIIIMSILQFVIVIPTILIIVIGIILGIKEFGYFPFTIGAVAFSVIILYCVSHQSFLTNVLLFTFGIILIIAFIR